VALFALGLLGVIVRRNVLVMLMCMELMLNGVNLSLVTFAQQTGTIAGAVLVFLIFVVATAEIALAIPIVLPGPRQATLIRDAYGDMEGLKTRRAAPLTVLVAPARFAERRGLPGLRQPAGKPYHSGRLRPPIRAFR
jgi:NADH-quinone oxidoreductase subunit K